MENRLPHYIRPVGVITAKVLKCICSSTTEIDHQLIAWHGHVTCVLVCVLVKLSIIKISHPPLAREIFTVLNHSCNQYPPHHYQMASDLKAL